MSFSAGYGILNTGGRSLKGERTDNMKTKYKYIEMQKMNLIDKRKTDIYIVKNIKSGWGIGHIKWHPSWRQYCFFPGQDSIYSYGCLDNISDFIFQLMKKRKEG